MGEIIDTGATFDRDGGGPMCDIDLKWSLWTEDLWEDYAPKTLAYIRSFIRGDAQETGDQLIIKTNPRKEIRYGLVVFSHVPNTDHFDVDVRFSEEWDDDSDLADTLGLDALGEEVLSDILPRVEGGDGEPGVTVIESKTFKYGTRPARVIAWIDKVEEQLFQANEAAWKMVEDWAKREEGE